MAVGWWIVAFLPSVRQAITTNDVSVIFGRNIYYMNAIFCGAL